MMRTICFILCAVLLVSCISGCGGGDAPYIPTGDALSWDEGEGEQSPETYPQQEQELVLAYYPNQSMNPLQSHDFTNRTLFSLMYQSLFAVDSSLRTTPVLCQNYAVSNDMRTYIFYVAPATFSDGSVLTPQDAYASLKYAMEVSPVYKGRFGHVTKLALATDGGIVFKLDSAHSDFPNLLDVPIVKASELEAQSPQGTGPYFMEQTSAGARLRRRTDWWCMSDLILNATSIPLVEAENAAHIRDQFEFSDVSLVCADPCSENYADFRSDYELWDCENGVFLYIGCNTGTSDIFSNARVRAALTYAIDRDYLINRYFRGFARSATLPASPMSPFYSKPLASRYEYNPQRFADVVKSEGFVGFPVRLLVNKDDTLRLRVAREIGNMLRACGLEVEMMELSWDDNVGYDYEYSVRARRYDIYVSQTKLSPNMDLSEFFREGGAFRYGGMTDAALYSLCLDALANTGNYYNLHKAVADDGRLTSVMFMSYAVYADRGLVSELTPARDNVFYYTLGRTMNEVQVSYMSPELLPDPTVPTEPETVE